MVIAKVFDKTLPEYAWIDPVRLWVNWAPRKLRDFAFNWQLKRLKAKGLPGPIIACNQTGAADVAICGSTHPGFLASMGQPPSWLDKRKIALEHEHLHQSSVVVAHSQLMKDEVVRYHNVLPDKIKLLYPPVDTARFNPVDTETRQALRHKFGLPEDRAVFLLASTGHKRKGLDLLANFFQQTKLPVTLVIAGRPISVKSENIRYLGYRSDIEDVYRAVDFTVMASSYEPFGLVGIESVLSGTPVVLVDKIGCAEVIDDEAGIRFSLDQVGTFETAMNQALLMWEAGTSRLTAPLAHLRYSPTTAQHLDGLLEICNTLCPDAEISA